MRHAVPHSLSGWITLSQFPRTLVITSCSDLKTQPKAGFDTRALQKRFREKYTKEIHPLEVLLRNLERQLENLEGVAENSEGKADHVEEEADSTAEKDKYFEVEARNLRAQMADIKARLELHHQEWSPLRAELGKYMLLREDFEDPDRLADRERTLADYMCPAVDMYAGPHHDNVKKGIRDLRERFGHDCVDLKIISAGYGLLDEEAVIAPYDITFTGMDGGHLDEWSRRLGIHDDIEAAIQMYDLVVFLLGKEYLRAVHLPVKFDRDRQRLVFIVSDSSLPFVNYDEDYGMVSVGNREVHDFGAAAVALKGRLFRLFAEAVIKNDWYLMEQLHKRPSTFLQAISHTRKKGKDGGGSPSISQLSLFDQDIVAANTSFPMTFFMPENEDRVDPNCDPWKLIPEDRKDIHDKQLADRYVYEAEILGEPPFDGLLISLHEISTWSEEKQQRIFEIGARTFLRYNHPGPVLGDCGAFTFNDHGEPPFTGADVIEQYRKLGVDMGVSVDYIIFPELWRSEPVEAQRRFNKNLHEARQFWEAWQHAHSQYPEWRFTPIGVAQGGTPEKFAEAVQELQAIGYRYIAMGGLARSTAPVIESCLKSVAPVLLADTQLHLFGFAKLDLVARFREFGVTSFDSTSPLVQGFMRGVYWDPRPEYFGTQYLAIRVPASAGRTAVQKSGQTSRDLAESRRLEEAVLTSLQEYDAVGSEENYKAARDALVGYSQFLQPWPYDPHLWESMKTLRARPWDYCSCRICQEWRIAAAVMRSNNHNRRRGFHNTAIFYRQKVALVGKGMKSQL